ncbi:flavin reductase family protein [Catenulispora yoronensis]|uniref:Flavin reductase family protein n=1 Tax=Catenulispora yoronensis TaxID=450799 RepID=A0ABP5H6I0_9ACTN
MPIDTTTFRDVMAHVAMPVTVVTTLDPQGRWHGATIGSLTSLSLDPPLVMFALGRTTTLHHPLCASPRFAISILTSTQHHLATRFAGTPTTRFDGDVAFLNGLPIVDAATAWLICDRWQLIPAGDHTIVIGQVDNAVQGPEAPTGPLVYHQRRYHGLEALETAGAKAA